MLLIKVTIKVNIIIDENDGDDVDSDDNDSDNKGDCHTVFTIKTITTQQ